jgi:2-polyprenyl-3-methyl-5-hydroxy-6-metoxy-1,4-benzoquinol methylase
MENKSHLTAITRGGKLSVPMRWLHTAGLLKGRVLDYGCGKGIDADVLGLTKYDPYHFPQIPRGKFDTITCQYVLNVIPTPIERMEVLDRIRQLLAPRGVAYITVRNDTRNLRGWTRRGTWQGQIKLSLPVVVSTSDFVIYMFGGV